MDYRRPVTNDIITIPDSLCRTERERQVLCYDILVYEEDETVDWAAVAETINAEFGTTETAASVRSVKDRITRRVEKMALRQEVNKSLLRDEVLIDRDVDVNTQRTELAKKVLGTSYVSTKSPSEVTIKRRVLVVSDFHGTIHPFILQSLLNEDYDLCIIAGDVFDQWGLHQSRLEGKSLTQQEKATYLDEEIIRMRAFCELLDEQKHAQFIVLAGNHDVRVEAAFVKLLAPIIGKESLLVRLFRTTRFHQINVTTLTVLIEHQTMSMCL